jgi:hypothetical protein
VLLRYSAENYLSLRDDQSLSLIASSLKDEHGSLVPILKGKHELLKVAAIYGANASGKTNVLSALQFVKNAIENSQRAWAPGEAIPRTPFALDNSADRPSRFAVEFLINAVRFEYGFSVTSTDVVEEWLLAYPRGKKQEWFTRKKGNKFDFNRVLKGPKTATENITRNNSLFISAAAQNNFQMLMPIYDFFSKRLSFEWGRRGIVGKALKRQCQDERTRSIIKKYLAWADFGIVDFEVSDVEMSDNESRKVMVAMKDLINALRRMAPAARMDWDETVTALSLVHKGPGDKGVPLNSSYESKGTIAFLSILLPIVEALDTGSLLMIDELEASLHPLLALRIIRLFGDKATNPKNAQLIFTTHDTNLLNALRRDQIWFTEKDDGGATHLYPLSDFKPRKNENLERGYLQGRYGAIPFLGSSDLLAGNQARD